MKIATIVYIFRLDVRQWNGRMGMGCDAEPMGWSVQRGHSIAIGGGYGALKRCEKSSMYDFILCKVEKNIFIHQIHVWQTI